MCSHIVEGNLALCSPRVQCKYWEFLKKLEKNRYILKYSQKKNKKNLKSD